MHFKMVIPGNASISLLLTKLCLPIKLEAPSAEKPINLARGIFKSIKSMTDVLMLQTSESKYFTLSPLHEHWLGNLWIREHYFIKGIMWSAVVRGKLCSATKQAKSMVAIATTCPPGARRRGGLSSCCASCWLLSLQAAMWCWDVLCLSMEVISAPHVLLQALLKAFVESPSTRDNHGWNYWFINQSYQHLALGANSAWVYIWVFF